MTVTHHSVSLLLFSASVLLTKGSISSVSQYRRAVVASHVAEIKHASDSSGANGRFLSYRRLVQIPRGRAAALIFLLCVAINRTLVGLLIGAALAAVVWWLVRRDVFVRRAQRTSDITQLPGLLDLLAVCLSSGMPIGVSLDLVASKSPSTFAGQLKVVADSYQLGASPTVAWSDHMRDPALGPLARAVTRSHDTGSALSATFNRLAEDLRSDLVYRAEAVARRVGVYAMAPLGLCFLPAFVCLGVTPVVLSLAQTIVDLQ